MNTMNMNNENHNANHHTNHHSDLSNNANLPHKEFNYLSNDPEQQKLQNRIIGLAGIFQAAAMVKQIATTGRTSEPYFRTSIESLFKIDAKDALDVYGGRKNLVLGFQELIRLFTHNKNPKDADIARYVLSLIHLERKMDKDLAMKKVLQNGIERAFQQSQHFSTTHENVMANLASLYADTLSTFKFRIYVSGEPLYLNQTHLVNKVRALLLAGVRASVLWHQMGGRRWQLLISRNSIIQTAKQCLNLQSELESETVG